MGDGTQRRRADPHAPVPGAGREPSPARGRDDRPLPGARLGSADPDRGDARLLRRRGARRQDPVRRGQQLPRLAAAEGGAAGPVPRARADRDPAAAVQPADPRHRVRARGRVPQREHRHPAVVAAGRRLADRQVRARPGARPAPPGSARTRSAAWRPTPRATRRNAPGRSSTPYGRSPRGAASRCRRRAWPGSRTGPRSPRRSSARARSSSSTTTSAPPTCTCREGDGPAHRGQRPDRLRLSVRRAGRLPAGPDAARHDHRFAGVTLDTRGHERESGPAPPGKRIAEQKVNARRSPSAQRFVVVDTESSELTSDTFYF
jgi:hypothetical protein